MFFKALYLHIFSSHPNLAASGQHTCFCLFYAFAPKFLVWICFRLFLYNSHQLISNLFPSLCFTFPFCSFIHSQNICHKNIKSHQIIEKNLLSQQEKNSNGDRPFAKFKLTEQGQVYTLQTSTCLLLQTNPLPLQISNGENMKSLWVTKLKMIENQKGLALQSWI